jgi:hypothetical protein
LRVTEVLSPAEQAHADADGAAWRFGQACAAFRDGPRFQQHPPLVLIVNTLMTELWDRGFSQTEIRHAFQDALSDMNRYAAGAERRG